jgi:hypothetical protein
MSEFGTAEIDLLRNLVRRVDKNLEHQARLSPDAEHVVMSLKLGKLKGEVRLPLEIVHEAGDSLANTEALRQRIKRARDSMKVSVGQVPLQKNSIDKPPATEGSFFVRSGGSRQPRR